MALRRKSFRVPSSGWLARQLHLSLQRLLRRLPLRLLLNLSRSQYSIYKTRRYKPEIRRLGLHLGQRRRHSEWRNSRLRRRRLVRFWRC